MLTYRTSMWVRLSVCRNCSHWHCFLPQLTSGLGKRFVFYKIQFLHSVGACVCICVRVWVCVCVCVCVCVYVSCRNSCMQARRAPTLTSVSVTTSEVFFLSSTSLVRSEKPFRIKWPVQCVHECQACYLEIVLPARPADLPPWPHQ